MSLPRMHYYPAALIGQFHAADSRREGRDASVWVARRGLDVPVRAAASKCGVDPDAPQLYATEDGGGRLDELWQRSEKTWQDIRWGIEAVRESGTAPASWFVNVLAPFGAQLLARPPRLMLDELSDLTDAGPGRDAMIEERAGIFGQFVDALLYSRRWLLVDVPDGSLVSSDLGWHWLPGEVPGEVFMPVSPTAALVIRGGRQEPTYRHGDEWVDIPVVQWERDQVQLRTEAMMLGAPREVFCSTREQAERAIALWGTDEVPAVPAVPLAQGLVPFESWVMAGALLDGAARDPALAMCRFMVASHRFGECTCKDEIRANAANREERRRMEKNMHHGLRIAERSLVRR